MPSLRRLMWDTWNVAHIARHEVTPEEAEQVCHGHPAVLQSYSGRLLLIGPTEAGKMLAVVLDPLGRGAYYPVTARPASRKERRYYRDQKAGEQ